MNKMVFIILLASVLISALALCFYPLPLNQNGTLVGTKPPLEEPDNSVTLVFGGDLMFDRYIREQQAPIYESVFSHEVQQYFLESDGVIANLEGPITSFDSVADYNQNNPNHFRFTFPPKIASVLARNNFIAVSLGNNHSSNFGEGGIEQSIQFLDEVAIQSFGSPYDPNHIAHLESNGIKFGLLAYNYSDATPLSTTLKTITKLRDQVDHIVILAHWGTEYEPTGSEEQQTIAQSLIGAGADLIIGSHPHVTQNKVVLANKTVYYSLGNLVFDQYFSPAVRCGLLVSITFSKDGYSVNDEKTTYLETDGSTRFAVNECSD